MKELLTAMVLLAWPTAAWPQPIGKCGTVAILEGRFKGMPTEEERRLRVQATYLSPSGKFRMNYDVTGANAVPTADTNSNGIPDYIERAARYIDEAWQLQVATQGFRDPVGNTVYNVFFEQIGFYGYTQPSGGRTFIVVHRNFEGFPPNTDPEGNVWGALKVTMAHEFKHAVQYATNQWTGDAGRTVWVEMDATMMEEVQYPQVNDYWNYLRSASIFTNPNGSTPGSYPHVTWMLHYHERLGIGFWRDVWETVGASGMNMFPAVSVNLTPRNLSYTETFSMNHAWHFASGDFSRPGFGFVDRQQFPTPNMTQRVVIPDSLMPPATVNRSAARYYRLQRGPTTAGAIQVSVDHSLLRTGVTLLAYKSDGTIETQSRIGDESGTIRLSTGWVWDDLDFLGMVVANASESATLGYRYRIDSESVPETPTLRQNHPNPFNPSTRIIFTLPRRQNVRLEVFDVLGRSVALLVDGQRNSGRHELDFDAGGLASGVYVYLLSTQDGVRVRRMTLIR